MVISRWWDSGDDANWHSLFGHRQRFGYGSIVLLLPRFSVGVMVFEILEGLAHGLIGKSPRHSQHVDVPCCRFEPLVGWQLPIALDIGSFQLNSFIEILELAIFPSNITFPSRLYGVGIVLEVKSLIIQQEFQHGLW